MAERSVSPMLNPMVARLRNGLPWQFIGQTALLLAAVLLTLAGSFVIGATNYGIFVIAGVIVLIMAGMVASYPPFGLYALIVFVYLNLSDVLKEDFGIPSVIRPLVGLMFVSVLANRLILHRKPLVLRTVESAVAAYGIVIMLSTFVAADKGLALDAFGDWLKDFVILLIILQLAREEHIWKKMQWLLVLSAGLLSLLTCIQALTHNYNETFLGLASSGVHQITNGFDSNRSMGPLDDPNFFAQILLMTVPMSMYRALTDPVKRNRIVGGVCTALTMGAIAFTYSRAAFIAAVVILVLIMIERKMNMLKVGLATAIVVIAVIPFLPAGYLNRLMTLDDAVTDQQGSLNSEQSFRGRYSEANIAINMFLDHPILGVGAANYPVYYQDYSASLGMDPRAEARKAHNTYLQIAAEKGAVGLLVFITMIIAVIGSIRKAKRQARQLGRDDLIPWISAVQYGLLAYLFTSFFLHDDYMRYLWLMIAVAVSASAVTELLVQQHKEAESFDVQGYTESAL